MENRLISHELEEMKIQIDNLKKKLEDQTIVNEKHIRNSFRIKISDINRTVTMTVIACILALVYCTWFFHFTGLSLAFTIATGLMLAVCVLLTLIQKIQLSRIDISAGNLVETARDISKIRTHYKDWYKTAIPMIIIWFGWMTYEILTRFEMTPMTIGFLSGAATGGILGGVIGGRINKKIINRTEELLGYIEELQKEN
ncbi:MAG: hypothetical protein II289_09500 [Bacteroidales bacterium]|nr:hypothetical protein [Bacteroidales bacterium]